MLAGHFSQYGKVRGGERFSSSEIKDTSILPQPIGNDVMF
ncbi:hypothetical protein C7S17_4297 [Burkholderia thailandensis]|nr:hypothetical protein [Burkholderia thailandensis]